MTQTDKQTVPKLRFPGFEGAWGKTTLGEVSTCLDNKRVPLKEGDRALRQGNIPYYGASGVIDYIDDFLFDEPLVLLAEDGANIIMRSTPVAFIARGKYWVNNHAHVYRAHGSTEFLAEALERIDFIKYNTGTAQPKLNGDMCKKLPLRLPTLPEQRKIASFLGAMDTKIALLVEKKRLLEDYKKGCMQQLFSQKIRFKDEDGKDFPDWKEKRLGEVVTLSAGTSKSKYISESGDRFIVDMGSVASAGRLICSKRTQFNDDLLDVGDLVMPKDDIGGGNIIGKVGLIDKTDTYVLGDHVYRLQVHEQNSIFLTYLINSSSINKSLRRKANGTAQLGLARASVLKQPISLPHPAEQRKIADFLSALDRKIDLVGAELEHARTFKKGLLQQMFV